MFNYTIILETFKKGGVPVLNDGFLVAIGRSVQPICHCVAKEVSTDNCGHMALAETPTAKVKC